MKITELKTDAEVFEGIGPFAMDKDVNKELAVPLIHSENKRWFVAEKDGEIIGLSCIEEKKNASRFCHSFVVEEFRDQGVYDKMLLKRIKEANNDNIETTCKIGSTDTLKKMGFKIVKQLKAFTCMAYKRK